MSAETVGTGFFRGVRVMHAPNTWEETPPRTPSVLASSFSLEVPVWLTSMFVHMAIILWLGTQWMPQVGEAEQAELQASIEPLRRRKEAGRAQEARVPPPPERTAEHRLGPHGGHRGRRLDGAGRDGDGRVAASAAANATCSPTFACRCVQDLVSAPQQGTEDSDQGGRRRRRHRHARRARSHHARNPRSRSNAGRRSSSGSSISPAACRSSARRSATASTRSTRARAQQGGRRRKPGDPSRCFRRSWRSAKTSRFAPSEPTDDLRTTQEAPSPASRTTTPASK